MWLSNQRFLWLCSKASLAERFEDATFGVGEMLEQAAAATRISEARAASRSDLNDVRSILSFLSQAIECDPAYEDFRLRSEIGQYKFLRFS
jgi:hypothetical protein